jgi:hypothetical protein
VAPDVRADHGRRNVAMAEELLYSADNVSAFEQVRGEGMPEGVAGDSLADAGRPRRFGHGSAARSS